MCGTGLETIERIGLKASYGRDELRATDITN